MDNVQIIQCPICGEELEVPSVREWEKKYELERKMLKDKAHKSFDAIWKTGIVERTFAYSWLAKELGIDYKECHFSNLSRSQLKQAIAICELAKARMLKAFCETKWEPQNKNGSVANRNGIRNSLNGERVGLPTPDNQKRSERKFGLK